MSDFQTGEYGRMWRETAQTLHRHIEFMVSANIIGKGVAMASEVGMSDNEWYNRISLSPRTPLTTGERRAIMYAIKKHDVSVYEAIIREDLCDDNIVVAR